MNIHSKNLAHISTVDKLREHILRIHAKISTPKSRKSCESNIKNESIETLNNESLSSGKHCDEPLCEEKLHIETLNDSVPRDMPSIESCSNNEDAISTEDKDATNYWAPKSMQSGDELPEVVPTETSDKPRFKPKVPPTDYERFIYKCQYCMLGFKRRGKMNSQSN